jgi:hypothetical protein
MAKIKLRNIRLGEREIQILIFLWKWKIVSNAALSSQRFFPNAGVKRAYNRLLDLKHANLIEVRADLKLQNYAWILTRKGFQAIKEFIPDLREDGFKSENFEHDMLVTMFHLGDWLIDRPKNVTLFAEQEIRRIEFDHFPDWVDRSDLHRPDGYFKISNDVETKIIAIEVELNRKRPDDYYSMGSFYSTLNKIDRVLWLIPNVDSINRLQIHLNQTHSNTHDKHNFILKAHFQKHGWKARILKGAEAGLTVREFMDLALRRKGVESTWTSTSRLLLNTRKSYLKSVGNGKSSTPL